MKKIDLIILFFVVLSFSIVGMDFRIYDIGSDICKVEFANQSDFPVAAFYASSEVGPGLNPIVVMPYEDTGKLKMSKRTDAYLATQAGIFLLKIDNKDNPLNFSLVRVGGNIQDIQIVPYDEVQNVVVLIEQNGNPKMIPRVIEAHLNYFKEARSKDEMVHIGQVLFDEYVTQNFISAYMEYIKNELSEKEQELFRYHSVRNSCQFQVSNEINRDVMEKIISKANKHFTKPFSAQLATSSSSFDISSEKHIMDKEKEEKESVIFPKAFIYEFRELMGLMKDRVVQNLRLSNRSKVYEVKIHFDKPETRQMNDLLLRSLQRGNHLFYYMNRNIGNESIGFAGNIRGYTLLNREQFQKNIDDVNQKIINENF